MYSSLTTLAKSSLGRRDIQFSVASSVVGDEVGAEVGDEVVTAGDSVTGLAVGEEVGAGVHTPQ